MQSHLSDPKRCCERKEIVSSGHQETPCHNGNMTMPQKFPNFCILANQLMERQKSQEVYPLVSGELKNQLNVVQRLQHA